MGVLRWFVNRAPSGNELMTWHKSVSEVDGQFRKYVFLGKADSAVCKALTGVLR